MPTFIGVANATPSRVRRWLIWFGRRAHPQRQDDRSVDGDHGHRFVRQEAPVADRTHPPLLHRDVRPLVERLGRVQVGERDRGIDAGARRERLHHGPSEVLAGLQHPRPEGVGAVAVGGEVPHPVVVLAHEVDRRPGPRVARPDVAPAEGDGLGRGALRCHHRQRWEPRSCLTDGGVDVGGCGPYRVRRRDEDEQAGEQGDPQRRHDGERVHATAKPSSPSMHAGRIGNPA